MRRIRTGIAAMHVDQGILMVFVTLLALVNDLCAVKITNLSVPRWIQNGTAEEVILDCEYSMSDKDAQLVLKWFLNEDPKPIYQWIRELGLSTTTNTMQGRIYGDANGNNDITNPSQHRSLRIKNPTTEFTGKYRCDIVSLENQDAAEGVMIVYAPPKDLEFRVIPQDSSEGTNITCEADGVYPLPQLRVYQITPGAASRKHLPGKKTLTQNSGIYNISLITELEGEDLPQQQILYFECELLIQGTDYVTNSRLQYIPGDIHPNPELDPDGARALVPTVFLLLVSTLACFIS